MDKVEQPTFKLSQLQSEFLQSKSRFCCAITGIGVGKTLILLLKAWYHCEQHPNALCLIIRREFTDLRDSTIRDFTQYFGKKLDMNNNYKFPNGSVMMFRHGNENDLSVLKNINLSFVGIEQGEEYENNIVFTWSRDRLRRAGSQTNQLVMICNANGMDWVHELFIQPATEVIDFGVEKLVLGRMINTGEIYYKRVIELGDEKQAYECWTANSFINAENLPKATLVDWLSMETDAPNHFQRMIMNSFDEIDDSDLLLTSSEIQKALHQEFLFNKNLYTAKIMSVDIAAEGKDHSVAVLLEQRGPMHWEETLFEKWKEPELMATTGKILALRGLWEPDVLVVDADGMGGGVFSRLKENGIECVGYRGGRILKNMKYPDRFTTKSCEDAFFLKEQMVQGSRLRIRPELISELQKVRYKHDSAGGKLMLVPKSKMPISPDHFDALKMGVAQVDTMKVGSYRGRRRQPRKAIGMRPFGGVR